MELEDKITTTGGGGGGGDSEREEGVSLVHRKRAFDRNLNGTEREASQSRICNENLWVCYLHSSTPPQSRAVS